MTLDYVLGAAATLGLFAAARSDGGADNTLTQTLFTWIPVGGLIGKVGGWPNDPGRSHLHLGVTAPGGRAKSVARIRRVAAAPRVAARAIPDGAT